MRTTVASAARRPAARNSASRERISAVSFQWFIAPPRSDGQRYLPPGMDSIAPRLLSVTPEGDGRTIKWLSRTYRKGPNRMTEHNSATLREQLRQSAKQGYDLRNRLLE